MENAWGRGVKVAAPDRLSYAAMLNAYAQSKDPLSVDSALDLFQRQHKQVDTRNRLAAPDSTCYNMVLVSLAKSRDAKVLSKAVSLFNEMKERYNQGDMTLYLTAL
jgi:hypothetical protein